MIGSLISLTSFSRVHIVTYHAGWTHQVTGKGFYSNSSCEPNSTSGDGDLQPTSMPRREVAGAACFQGIEEPLGDLLARNGDERAHPRGRRWYGTAIAAPAASRSEKSSSRKPRASPVTSPAMGCSASFVRVVARWAVSSKRSSRKTSSPSLSCHRAVSFLRSSTLCSLATRSATTPAMFHVEGALVGLGQVLQRERTHSRPRLPSRPDALRATSFPCTCAPQKVDSGVDCAV